LAAEGLLLDPLAQEVGKDLDPFDLICHVAFDQPPLTRRECANNVRKRDIFTKYGGRARAVLESLLEKYQDEGVTNLDERQHFGDIYEQILNDLQSAGNAGEYYTPRAVTAFMADRIDPKPGEILFDPACGTGGFLTCAVRHMRKRYVKTPEDEQTMQQAPRATEKKQLPHILCVTNLLLHGIDDPSFVRHDNTLAGHPALMRFKAKRCATLADVQAWVYEERHGRRTSTGEHRHTWTKLAAPTPVQVRDSQCPSSAEHVANAALSLLNLCCYLLDRQLAAQAAAFEKEGGFTECLYRVRAQVRTQPPKGRG
jgi:four helix bundle suffix protein